MIWNKLASLAQTAESAHPKPLHQVRSSPNVVSSKIIENNKRNFDKNCRKTKSAVSIFLEFQRISFLIFNFRPEMVLSRSHHSFSIPVVKGLSSEQR